MPDATGPIAFTLPSALLRQSVELDYLRTSVVLLVLAHHSAVGYAVFGHFDAANYLNSSAPIVDGARWFGCDLFYMATEVFFMPLLFLLSGLFVWSSLQRHGPGKYLRGRVLRLGLPFAVGLLVLMPLAFYPSFRLGGGATELFRYWWDTVSVGPRPNGPLWFIAVLLLFDVGVAAMVRARLDWSRQPSQWVGRHVAQPGRICAALVAASFAAYLPLLMVFGPARWMLLGPVLFQASRIALYGVYFAAGIAIGRGGGALLTEGGALARHWRGWLLAATLGCAGFVGWSLASRVVILSQTESRTITAVAFCLGAGPMGFALLAAFLRFAHARRPVLDHLTANAYGIYLVHYVPLVWLQYALLPVVAPVWLKLAIVATGTLALCWAWTAAVRRIPAVRAVI